MSGQIKQPKTQVPLTNVAIVRLNSNQYISENATKPQFYDEFEDESMNTQNKGRGKKNRKRNRRRKNKNQPKNDVNYYDDSSRTTNSGKNGKNSSNNYSNKKNKKFEIACYKNKVMDWRKGIEKDISEVLQIERVFENVKAGRYSNTNDLQQVFRTTNELTICKIILNKGELQVSKHERIERYENKFKEIANIISEKCVNTETKKPIPVQVIENSMREARCPEAVIQLDKSSKAQAMKFIKILQTHEKTLMPIERAQMKLQINIPSSSGKKIKPQIEHLFSKVESELFGNYYQLTVLVDPGHYRTIINIVAKHTRGKGNIHVLDTAVQKLGDEVF